MPASITQPTNQASTRPLFQTAPAISTSSVHQLNNQSYQPIDQATIDFIKSLLTNPAALSHISTCLAQQAHSSSYGL
jgi:hypothetical protein